MKILLKRRRINFRPDTTNAFRAEPNGIFSPKIPFMPSSFREKRDKPHAPIFSHKFTAFLARGKIVPGRNKVAL